MDLTLGYPLMKTLMRQASNSSDADFARLELIMAGPDMQVSSLPPLPREIRDVASRAANKSVPDLALIADIVRKYPAFALYPQLHNIFFRHLDALLPSHTQTPAEEEPTLELVALDGVLCTGIAFISEIWRDNSRMHNKFLKSWPSLWRWISYFYSKASLHQGYMTPAQLSTIDYRIMVTTLQLISYLLQFNDLSLGRAMTATPGIFPMVVKLWMVQADRKIDDFRLPGDCFSITCSLGKFLGLDAQEVRPDLERMRELANILGEDKQRIAKILLTHIRVITRQSKSWQLCFALLMDVTTMVSTNIPGVSNTLLSQNAIVDICHAMDVFASTEPDSALFLLNQMHCISRAVHYFVTAASATDGFTWITQALRAGILSSVLKWSTWDEKMEDLAIKVLGTIAPYTIYRSVLRVIGKTLLSGGFRRLEAELEAGGPFFQRWAAFKSVVQTNLAIKAIFDAEGKDSQPCAASDCCVVETTQSFRLCGACQEACYCSKECQQRDWKSGKHRAECKKILQNRADKLLSPFIPESEIMSFLDGVAAQISLRDRAFFMHVVLHDMKRSQEAIIRTRDKQLLVQPSTKHSFVVCFKHTVSPPKLAITTVQSYNQWCEKLIKPESPAPGPPVENIAPIQVKDTVVYPVLVVPMEQKTIQ